MQAPVSADKLCELRIPAVAKRLCLVRALVQRAVDESGCDSELGSQLVIAVNEACMNVIQHAYKGKGSGEIVLEIHNNGSHIFFRLLDNADPIDLDAVKSRELDDIRPGGLGVHFIREIMDEYEIGHRQGGVGNYLEMIKKIA